jgi:hypothetical protein
MIRWLTDLWASMTWAEIVVGAFLFILTFVGSYVAVSIVLIKLPANYFHSDFEHHMLPDRHPALRTAAIAIKNVLGVILILTGIVLSFPGVPGPGLLTIFIGVMLTDIPGKRWIEAKIISRPAVLATVNKLRAKYNKPEFQLD